MCRTRWNVASKIPLPKVPSESQAVSLQLPLRFELRDDFNLDTFVAGPNGALCARLTALGNALAPAGQGDMLWIHGAPGSGKTHLLQASVARLAEDGVDIAYFPAKQIDAVDAVDVLEGSERYRVMFIDDIDSWLGVASVERELVRRYQERRQAGTHLVLSAQRPPADYPMAFADWASRARGAEVFRVAELSDQNKLQVLNARATRLGLELGSATGTYLLRHGPRSLPAMLDVLDNVDKLAMAEQRKLTVPLLKKVLQATD